MAGCGMHKVRMLLLDTQELPQLRQLLLGVLIIHQLAVQRADLRPQLLVFVVVFLGVEDGVNAPFDLIGNGGKRLPHRVEYNTEPLGQPGGAAAPGHRIQHDPQQQCQHAQDDLKFKTAKKFAHALTPSGCLWKPEKGEMLLAPCV